MNEPITQEDVLLAQAIVRLVPKVRGLNRTVDQTIRDPRVMRALVDELERQQGVLEGWQESWTRLDNEVDRLQEKVSRFCGE
jgi:predicted nuclease with TOPRIM domain